MTIPTGSPPWLRNTSVADYGGHSSLTDYLGIGVINPRTDVTAAQLLRMMNDLASAVRSAPFCTIYLRCRDSLALDPLVYSVSGMRWNQAFPDGYAGGSPPGDYPQVLRNGADGAFRIVFASSYTDEFGVVADFAPKASAVSLCEGSAGGACSYVSGALTVDAKLYHGASYTPFADATATIEVW